MTQEAAKYPQIIKALHWLMAFTIIALIISGFTKDFWPKEAQPSFYYWHKSLGFLMLVSIFVRIAFRIAFSLQGKIPALPKEINSKEQLAAKLGHLALYIFMVILPLSGYLMSSFGGYPVNLFDLELPKILAVNKPLGGVSKEVHEIAGIIFAIIIFAHIAAVIKHKAKDGVNLLPRIR